MFLSVQYLRGIAAILVLAHHAIHKQGQLSGSGIQWNFGMSGVDLFFIVSGFIMCHVTARKEPSAGSFLRARAMRILPLYWLLTVMALAVFIANPNLVNSSGGSTTILNSFFLVPNGQKFLIQNGWTLSYEFLFYLIFAVSLCFSRVGRIPLVAAGILILVASGWVLQPSNPMLKFASNPLLLEFLMGIASYIYVSRYSRHIVLNLGLIAIALTALLAAQVFSICSERVVNFGVPFALLFAGVVGCESFFRRNAHNKFAVLCMLIGNASYSTYLLHPFVLAAVGVILKKAGMHAAVPNVALLMVCSLVGGIACYFCIEKKLDGVVRGLFRRASESTASPAS